MTGILIKSFNRPYYLDRCIASIFKNVLGDFRISILDDGTPEKYLTKIQEKYPNITIIKSDQYLQKVKAIEENLHSGKDINGFEIPTQLWKKAVEKSSDYVLVTEDDVWFFDKINLNKLVADMRLHHINMVKLGWLGNLKDERHQKTEPLNSLLNKTIPKKLFTSNEMIMDLFMYNKFKFFTILYKLNFFENAYKRRYWALNSILMGLYQKEYWLHIWKEANGIVDEKQQLRNAAVWYHRNKKNENFVAKTNKEYMKTTFQSSATNSYHQYDFDFDVNYFNHKMNEAWYHNNFDALQNYPNDFSLDYFEQFFDEKINKAEFRKWVEKFKNQYKNLGCNVDS